MTIRWKPSGGEGKRPKISVDPLTQGQKEIQDNKAKLWIWPKKYLKLQSQPYSKNPDHPELKLKQETVRGPQEDQFVLPKSQGCQILLAGPHLIKKWAQKQPDYFSGPIQKFRSNQVLCSDTFDYKTFKPYMKGLFCQTLFGKMYDKQTLIDRRHSLAYCQLPTPVMHIWYLKGTVCHLSRLLKIKRVFLERQIYMKGVTITSSHGFWGTNGANVRHLVKRPQSKILQIVNQLKSKNHPYIGYHFSNSWGWFSNTNSFSARLISYLERSHIRYTHDEFVPVMQYESINWYYNNLNKPQSFKREQKNTLEIIFRSPNFVQDQTDWSNDDKELVEWKPELGGAIIWEDGYNVLVKGSHDDASFSNYVIHDYGRGGIYTKPYPIDSSGTTMTQNNVYGLINVNTAWTNFYAQCQWTQSSVPQLNTKQWQQWTMYVFFLGVHQSERLMKVVNEISHVQSAKGLYYPQHKSLVSSRTLDSAINLFYGNISQNAVQALKLRQSVYSHLKVGLCRSSQKCFDLIYGPQPQLHGGRSAPYNKKTIVWSWHTQYSDCGHVDSYYEDWYQWQYTLQERHFSRKVNPSSTDDIRHELGPLSRRVEILLKNPFIRTPWAVVQRETPVRMVYEKFDDVREISNSFQMVEPFYNELMHEDLPSFAFLGAFLRQKRQQYKGEKFYSYDVHSIDDFDIINTPPNRFVLSGDKKAYTQIHTLALGYEQIYAFRNYYRFDPWGQRRRHLKQTFGEKQCWQQQLLWYRLVLRLNTKKNGTLFVQGVLQGSLGSVQMQSKPILMKDPRLIARLFKQVKPALTRGLEPDQRELLEMKMYSVIAKAAKKGRLSQTYMTNDPDYSSIWECTTYWNLDFWCYVWLDNQRKFALLQETNTVSWMPGHRSSKVKFRTQKVKKYQKPPKGVPRVERLGSIKTFWDIVGDITCFMHYRKSKPNCPPHAIYLALLPDTTINVNLSSNIGPDPYILAICFEMTHFLDQMDILFSLDEINLDWIEGQKERWEKAVKIRQKIQRALKSKHREPNPKDIPIFVTPPSVPLSSQRKKFDLKTKRAIKAQWFTIDSGQTATLAVLSSKLSSFSRTASPLLKGGFAAVPPFSPARRLCRRAPDIYSLLVDSVRRNKRHLNIQSYIGKENDSLDKSRVGPKLKVGLKSDTLAISWVKLNNLKVSRIPYTKIFKMIDRLLIVKEQLIYLQNLSSGALFGDDGFDKEGRFAMDWTESKMQRPYNINSLTLQRLRLLPALTGQSLAEVRSKLRLPSNTVTFDLTEVFRVEKNSNLPLIKWFVLQAASRKLGSFVTKLACYFSRCAVPIKCSRVKPGLRFGVQRSNRILNPAALLPPVPCEFHSLVKWTVSSMLQKQAMVHQIKQHSKALIFSYWTKWPPLGGFGPKNAKALTYEKQKKILHQIIDVFLYRFHGRLNSIQTQQANSAHDWYSFGPYWRQSTLKQTSLRRWNTALLWYYDSDRNPFVFQPCPMGVLNNQYVGHCDLPIHIEPLICVSEITLARRHFNAVKPETVCHLWTSNNNRPWFQLSDTCTDEMILVPPRMSQTKYYRQHKSTFLDQFKWFLERYPEFIRNKAGVWTQLTLLRNTKLLRSRILDDFITRPCSLISTASKGYAERSFSPVLSDLGPQSIVLQFGRLNQPNYGYDSQKAISVQGPYKRYRDQLQREVNDCNMKLKSSIPTMDGLAIWQKHNYQGDTFDYELPQLYTRQQGKALIKKANKPRISYSFYMTTIIIKYLIYFLEAVEQRAEEKKKLIDIDIDIDQEIKEKKEKLIEQEAKEEGERHIEQEIEENVFLRGYIKQKANFVPVSPTKWYESMPGQLTRQGYQKSWDAPTFNKNMQLAYHDQDTWDDSGTISAARYTHQPYKSYSKTEHILKKQLYLADWSHPDSIFLEDYRITGFPPPKHSTRFFKVVKTVFNTRELLPSLVSNKRKPSVHFHSLIIKSRLIDVALCLSKNDYGSLKQKIMQNFSFRPQASTSLPSAPIIKVGEFKHFAAWSEKVCAAQNLAQDLAQVFARDCMKASPPTPILERLAQQRLYPVGFKMDPDILIRSYDLCLQEHYQKQIDKGSNFRNVKFTNSYLQNIEADLQSYSRKKLEELEEFEESEELEEFENIRWNRRDEAIMAMKYWARLGELRWAWVVRGFGYNEKGIHSLPVPLVNKIESKTTDDDQNIDGVDVKELGPEVSLNVNVATPVNSLGQVTVLQPHFKYEGCDLPTLRLGKWPKRQFMTKYFALLNAKALYRLSPTELADVYFQMVIKLKKKIGQSFTKRAIACRQLRMIENFDDDQVEPSWLFMTRCPILPPDLRPMIVEPYGQTISSDLNKLYAQVIEKSMLIHNLFEDKAKFYDWDRDPWFENGTGVAVSKDWSYGHRVKVYDPREKKFYRYPNITDRLDTVTGLTWLQSLTQVKLQYCMDQLLQNGRGTRPALTGVTNPRPLKSLSDVLKGKKGRFRNNLLGKRVDYSGRSVIVVGPKLRLHQCGLPWEMAIVLFEPFLIRELRYRKLFKKFKIHKVKRLIKARAPIIVSLLKQLLQCRPILLNRAPTLHRLGVQAFQGQLISGRAILLHPLVCGGFNADFDGDQMAVHIPLGDLACAESWSLMWSQNHILSVATGDVVPIPSQDMVLGCYHLTTMDVNGRFMMLMNYILRQPITQMSAGPDGGEALWDSQTFTNVSDIDSIYQTCIVPKQTIVWLQCAVFECQNNIQETLELNIDMYGHTMEYHPEYKTYTYQYRSSNYIKTTIGKAIMNNHFNTILGLPSS